MGVEKKACPYHPRQLQEKLARLGWGDWVPTPGVTDEDKSLYVSDLEANQHMYVMSVEEAVRLPDEALEQALLDAIGFRRYAAIAEYERRKVK